MKFYRSLIIVSIILPFFFGCSASYKDKLEKSEKYFYSGDYVNAIDDVRGLYKDSAAKDRLLYLMEAGVIFHTKGDYKKSNVVFKQADEIAERIKISISKQALSFFLSDREKNFRGENFERVLIKFYIALNYIMLGDYRKARIYFKKLNYDLKVMKYTEGKYKQNVAARYLNAVLSEYFQEYNSARVEYKNISMIDPGYKEILGDKFVLAVKAGDDEDIKKYKTGEKYIECYDNNLKRVSYNTNMGELIVIHEAGKAAIKVSRGRLLDDRMFAKALRAAITIALHSKGAAISTSSVIAMLGTAENPIPVYKKRDLQGEHPINLFLNSKNIGKTRVVTDYSMTAIKNFNENYSKYVAKNITSIATKIVIAAIAANEASKRAEKASGNNVLVGSLGRFIIGASAGGIVAASVKPDLRCWHLLPSNFQIKRVFLEPGEYNLNIEFMHNRNAFVSSFPEKIVIEKGKPLFVNFRSFTL